MARMDVWGPSMERLLAEGYYKCDIAMQHAFCLFACLHACVREQLIWSHCPLLSLHCAIARSCKLGSGGAVCQLTSYKIVLWSRSCTALAGAYMHGQVQQQQMRC